MTWYSSFPIRSLWESHVIARVCETRSTVNILLARTFISISRRLVKNVMAWQIRRDTQTLMPIRYAGLPFRARYA